MEETRSPREATDAAPEETRSPVSTPRTRLFRARRRRNVQIVPLPVTLAEIERFARRPAISILTGAAIAPTKPNVSRPSSWVLSVNGSPVRIGGLGGLIAM